MPEQFTCERVGRLPLSALIWHRIARLWQGAGKTARLMIGVPDYRTYVEHCQKTHPETPPMTYEAFFRSRMEARYAGRKRMGCC